VTESNSSRGERLLYSGDCRAAQPLVTTIPPSHLLVTTEQPQTPRSPGSTNADINTGDKLAPPHHTADAEQNGADS